VVAILKYLLPVTLDRIRNISVELLDPENVDVAVGISMIGYPLEADM
jgi:hypothetical protein